MKKTGMIRHLFTACLISLSLYVSAQEDSYNNWQLGVYGGISQYYGDISNKTWSSKFADETKFSFGAMARYHFSELHGLGLHFQHSAIYSEKPLKADETTVFDLKYSGTYNHISLQSYLNFTNFLFGVSDRKVDIYGTLGIGVITWNGVLSKISNGNLVVDNTTAAANFLKTRAATFPIGIGLAFTVAPNVKINIESSLTTVLSDEIDFFIDWKEYDILTSTHIGISYSFGGSQVKSNKVKASPTTATKWEPETPISVIEYEIYNDPPIQKPKTEALPQLQLPTKTEVVTKEFAPFEFRVQVYAKNSRVAIGERVYRNVQFDYPIVENTFNGLYRYSTGSFQSYSEAEAYAHKMQSRGIYDAFVVAYRNNERISITSDMKKR